MIEVILDKCLEEIHARRATVDECLAEYPDYAAELAPLLSVASALERASLVKPSNEFRAMTRQRLARLTAPPPRLRELLVDLLNPGRA